MILLWSLFEIFATFIQAFVHIWFIDNCLDSKFARQKSRKISIVASLAQACFVMLMNAIVYFEGVGVVLFVCFLFTYAAIFREGKFSKKAIVAILPILCTVIVASVIHNVVAHSFSIQVNDVLVTQALPRLVHIVVCQLLTYYVLVLLMRIFRLRGIMLNILEGSLVVGVLILSIIIFALIDVVTIDTPMSSNSHFSMVLCMLGLIAINVVTIILVTRLSKANDMKTKNSLLEQRIKHQEQYSDIAQQQYQATRIAEHDMKHNLCVLSLLIKQGEYDKAAILLDEYIDSTASGAVLIDTNNDSLNAIISLKLSYARSIGIKTFCAVPDSFELLSSSEICSVFGNMLDNAIEYCKKYPDKDNEISVTITADTLKTTLTVKNKLHGLVMANGNRLVTDKADKQKHGFGLESISQIAKRNGGIFDYYEKNNAFYAKVILFK